MQYTNECYIKNMVLVPLLLFIFTFSKVIFIVNIVFYIIYIYLFFSKGNVMKSLRGKEEKYKKDKRKRKMLNLINKTIFIINKKIIYFFNILYVTNSLFAENVFEFYVIHGLMNALKRFNVGKTTHKLNSWKNTQKPSVFARCRCDIHIIYVCINV